jgi:hypothetical protein
LALQRVASKPYVVTEYNHPVPHTFSSEAYLLSSVYTAMQDWAAITLAAIGGDFHRGHIPMTTTGYTENTDMVWKNSDKSSVGKNWGKAPSLVEDIRATITLAVPANRVQAFVLDKRGQRVGAMPVRGANGNAVETSILNGLLIIPL